MKQIITKEFYGKQAEFFLNHKVRISKIEKLNRERSATTITFEVDE